MSDETLYVIRRGGGAPVAGVFAPIKTIELARATLARWQHNHPGEEFYISIANTHAEGAGNG